MKFVVVPFQEAYFRLAKEYHPDSTSSIADTVKFTQIEESYRYIVVGINFAFIRTQKKQNPNAK